MSLFFLCSIWVSTWSLEMLPTWSISGQTLVISQKVLFCVKFSSLQSSCCCLSALFIVLVSFWCSTCCKSYIVVLQCTKKRCGYMYHIPAFLHVISLTVPSSTEAVGSNPFDDEDDEEQMPAVQPNSSPANVKKDEVVAKMLVNRKHLLLLCSCLLHIYFLLLLPYTLHICFLFTVIFPQLSLSGACYFSAWLQCRSCVKHPCTHVVVLLQCNLVISHATVQSDLFSSVLKIALEKKRKF